MGRPAKLTPAIQKQICDALSAGSYLEDAARYGGISYQTFRNWMIRGEDARTGMYFEFFEAVTRAEINAKVTALAMWRRAFSDDWRAIAAWLERRYSDEWGRKYQPMQGVQQFDGVSDKITDLRSRRADRAANMVKASP